MSVIAQLLATYSLPCLSYTPKPMSYTSPSLNLLLIIVFAVSTSITKTYFFLLSIFWGNHLWFGEVIGELSGLLISLIGLSLLATYDFKVFAVSMTIFVIYSTISYGFLQISSMANYVFNIAASLVFMVWFFVWGTHATEGHEWKRIYDNGEENND